MDKHRMQKSQSCFIKIYISFNKGSRPTLGLLNRSLTVDGRCEVRFLRGPPLRLVVEVFSGLIASDIRECFQCEAKSDKNHDSYLANMNQRGLGEINL